MLFSSPIFLFLFLPAVLLLYYIAPRKARNLILFIFSLVFYAWGEPVYVFLMIGSTIVAYITGLLADKTKEGRKAWVPKVSLIIAVLWNMGLLLFFKYTDFFIGNANDLFGLHIELLGLKDSIAYIPMAAISAVTNYLVIRTVVKYSKKKQESTSL